MQGSTYGSQLRLVRSTYLGSTYLSTQAAELEGAQWGIDERGPRKADIVAHLRSF
jgi:hypothetical protein